MRIEGTDAGSLTVQKRQQGVNPGKSGGESGTDVNYPAGVNDLGAAVAESINITRLSEYEKKELPISERVVIDAIEKANKAIMGANTKFEFSIHEKTKEIMVKVIDADTHEVIREIPPEKILDMVAKMWEMAGIIVDERG